MAINTKEEFYSSTISGVNLKCKFAFPKIYFTKNQEDLYKRIYYDIGFITDIGWQQSNSASAKFNLTSIAPIDVYSGAVITEGSIAFKIFHHDSLERLKDEILKGINQGKDTINFPDIYDSPFVSLNEEWEEWDFHNDGTQINWAQMPLFDVILIAEAKDELNNVEIRQKTIHGVKITSQGFGQSIDSIEMSAVATFMAIGVVSDWELVSKG